ncbi:hypothetical protein BDW42DRAFT_107848 [Aspergillus taichungensis]|uniref:Uncharacterized protein n=1 Tax=Aspergillus taichungensis TaxID=482145 RepID=A0A2J5I7W1_9EURO|nr:hypothetical protein BDW42DRAFT_107848 [Aspergillus taichungensis]
MADQRIGRDDSRLLVSLGSSRAMQVCDGKRRWAVSALRCFCQRSTHRDIDLGSTRLEWEGTEEGPYCKHARIIANSSPPPGDPRIEMPLLMMHRWRYTVLRAARSWVSCFGTKQVNPYWCERQCPSVTLPGQITCWWWRQTSISPG